MRKSKYFKIQYDVHVVNFLKLSEKNKTKPCVLNNIQQVATPLVAFDCLEIYKKITLLTQLIYYPCKHFSNELMVSIEFFLTQHDVHFLNDGPL